MVKKQTGFTLIEVIIFIVIMGIVAVAVLVPMGVALRKSANLEESTQALSLAQQRMEIIVGQRFINGFSSFTDICASSPPAGCPATPSGYTVTSAIANNWNGDTDYKVITVTVSGDGDAVLKTLVAS